MLSHCAFFLLGLLGISGRVEAQEYDRQPLQQLTEFRKQHRRTIDGRLCAAAFVQEDHTYTDCTNAPTPDGTVGQGEWCYVEVQLLGQGMKDWAYCLPPINYDKVRMKAKEAFDMKLAEAEKMIARLDGSHARVHDMLIRFDSACGLRHDSLSTRVDKAKDLLSRGQSCLRQVESSTAKIALVKKAISDAGFDIAKSKAIGLTRSENCERVPGYEDEPFPDGLQGAFFGNAVFEGAPKGFRKDSPIDFIFSGAGPVEGLPSHKYSVRWDGFIKAPHSGEMIFSTISDSGVRVFINDEAVVVDRMPKGTAASAYGNKAVPLLPLATKTGIQKTSSAPIQLVGGQKYKIRIEMVHSHHFKFSNPDTTRLKLLWKSGQIREEVIPARYFYSSNLQTPVKFSSLDPHLFQITSLYDGEKAFADSSQFFTADVPDKYAGLRMLRTLAEPSMDYFEVTVNVPSNIYVASPKDQALPFGPFEDHQWKAHDTGDSISVYRGTDPLGRAIESTTMALRMIPHREGGRISFQVLEKYVPFILIFEAKKEEVSSCGGKQQNLSLVGGDEYAGCEVSSATTEAFSCEAALNGKHSDQKNGVWRTSSGNGVGEYISVHFRRPVQITHFKFKPRSDPVTWPSEITLTYSAEGEDEAESFAILHTSSLEHNTYKLNRPIITNFVKAEITHMYLNGEDSGGSFEFLGTPCSNAAESDEEELKTVAIESCDMTIENITEILPLEEGEQFIADCPRRCLVYTDGIVYGAGTYAPESSLCTAAKHSGACSGAIESCRMLVTVAGPQKSFPSMKLFGITSQSHGPSDISINVTKSGCTDTLVNEPKPHYKVSFRSDGSIPSGYLVDDGSVKRLHGNVAYGWLRPAKAASCGLGMFTNPINSGGIMFPPASSSRDCVAGMDCSTNFWSISLPLNGKYRVDVLVGHPCEPKEGKIRNYLQVNGVPLVKGVELEREKYFTASTIAVVSDKMLVLSAECDETGDTDLCKDAVTTILAVDIEKLEK